MFADWYVLYLYFGVWCLLCLLCFILVERLCFTCCVYVCGVVYCFDCLRCWLLFCLLFLWRDLLIVLLCFALLFLCLCGGLGLYWNCAVLRADVCVCAYGLRVY